MYCIGDLIKKYEENNNTIDNKSIDKKEQRLIKTKDVVKEYPILSLYAIDKAVKDKKLSYVKVGNTNYFDVNDIESFIMSDKRNGDD